MVTSECRFKATLHQSVIVSKPAEGTLHKGQKRCSSEDNECMIITHRKSKDQPGKVANPARGQLNRENEYFPVPVRA